MKNIRKFIWVILWILDYVILGWILSIDVVCLD